MKVTYRNKKTGERIVIDPRSEEAARLARSGRFVKEPAPDPNAGRGAVQEPGSGSRGNRRNARAVAGSATGTADATEPATE